MTALSKEQREEINRKKVEELVSFFDDIEIKEGEEVRLSECEVIVDVKKFIKFSVDYLNGKTLNKITRPYIIRFHKLRQYYEQKR